MPTIRITINRDTVFDEVSKLTDYIGSKSESEDKDIRDRVLATNNSLSDLNRFWSDSILVINERFKQMVDEYLITGSTFALSLDVSMSFDVMLAPEVTTALTGFIISSITGRWFKITNKAESAEYMERAAEFLKSAERLLYSRKKPTRPTI